MSDSASVPAPRRARAPRTLVQKLVPIILGFEAIVVLLAGLTIFGLKALPSNIPQWWAIIGAVIVAVAMIAVAGMITRPWAIYAGWSLQVVVALASFFVPVILLVALIFGGMLAYATIMGARLDAPRPADANSNISETDTHTESD
ncbi:DUF4233 domain-containing protein [Microbacterium sp. A84]|uniref:DUF4233 domain-containing protein n=1 Tax=Microbacterium sp. A84 TaxID=3450715 RepID=UPI003F43CDF4